MSSHFSWNRFFVRLKRESQYHAEYHVILRRVVRAFTFRTILVQKSRNSRFKKREIGWPSERKIHHSFVIFGQTLHSNSFSVFHSLTRRDRTSPRLLNSQRNNPYDNRVCLFYNSVYASRVLRAFKSDYWILQRAIHLLLSVDPITFYSFLLLFSAKLSLIRWKSKKRENTATTKLRWTVLVRLCSTLIRVNCFFSFVCIAIMKVMRERKWEQTEHHELSERIEGETLLFGNPKLDLHHFGLNICTFANRRLVWRNAMPSSVVVKTKRQTQT